MKINLTNELLSVVLEGKEKVWALKKIVNIEASSITNVEWVTGTVNKARLNGWRAPGTGVPRTFYAGSIYKKAGWEFWYLKAKQPGYLVITTDKKKYHVVRLTVDEKVGVRVREWFEDLMHERRR
jgi:hypothetical protein